MTSKVEGLSSFGCLLLNAVACLEKHATELAPLPSVQMRTFLHSLASKEQKTHSLYKYSLLGKMSAGQTVA